MDELVDLTNAEREELHAGRLYLEALDKAIVSEVPLTYSKSKIIEILCSEIAEDRGVITEYVEEEIEPLFNLSK